MSAYTPPGPQTPFTKDRPYGQQPGFVSRNIGKIIALIVVMVVLGAIGIVTSLVLRGDKTAEFTSEDYRAGQEQFIALIGETAFAEFEHGHQPLNCSDTEWEVNPIACSETWLHRFDIAELTGQIIRPESVTPVSE